MYLDLLFLRNCIADGFLMAASSVICGHKIRWGRLGVVSFAGGVYGVLPILIGGFIKGNLLQNMLAGVVLCVLFWGPKRKLSQFSSVFFLFSFFLVGVSYGLKWVPLSENSIGSFFGFQLFVGSISLLPVLFFQKSRNSEGIFETEIRFQGRSVRVFSFLDTGNTLLDFVSGRYVLICESRSVMPLFSKELMELNESKKISIVDFVGLVQAEPNGKWRYVPVKTVTGTKMMLGFLPDEVRTERKLLTNIIVVLTDEVLDEKGRFTALTGNWI